MYVIGTAGHVDHGKSTLVQALTGIDPDRLREEKERGLTIDLGFAWLTLPSGDEVSIVDVPGHERFIKNMLAGVGGIDMALLVIAADEGVMPQTREHLAIIDLLGVEHGVVAVTKADLVDADLLTLAEADAEEAIAGTTLDGSPVVACSGVTREGLDRLVEAIRSQLAKTPRKRDAGRPRLPIDRAFTMTGFGTVVTGTLIDGSLQTGQEVEVQPGGLRSRIRGLQSHGRKVDAAPPGRRTAVNLTGLAVDQLRRGMVVAPPGTLRPTFAIDVRLRAVRYLDRPIRHNLPVTFHTGAAEAEGRLLLLDADGVPPGGSAWAQVRLDEPVVAVRGDHFIVRDPNDTLGGGRIVDVDVRRHRRSHAPTLAGLEALEKGSPEEQLLMAISRLEPVDLHSAAKSAGIDAAEALSLAGSLLREGRVVNVDGGAPTDNSLVYSSPGFEALWARLREWLGAYHEQHPLRRGIPREELRSRAGLVSRAFDGIIAVLAARGDVYDSASVVALPEHRPALTKAQEAAADAYLKSLRANPYSPPTDNAPQDELLAYLLDDGQAVHAGDGVVFEANAYRKMVDRITAHLREHGTVTLAQVRDMFGTSRKYAQALLEHLDAQRVTRRVGDERVLR